MARGRAARKGSPNVSDRRLHASVWLVFFVNGAVLSSWAPRIPDVATALSISDAHLGAALLAIAAGAIPAMAAAGPLARRLPVTWVCLAAVSLFAAGLPLIGFAGNVVALAGALMLLGAASGLCDVTMNVLGIALQHHRRRPLLSGLHSGYSLGVLFGASGAVAATLLGASVTVHFGVVAGVLLVMSAAAAPAILRFSAYTITLNSGSRPAASPRRRLLVPVVVVVLAISGLLAEGLITDWSALLLTRDMDAAASQGATTLTLFSLAMFVSRASADRLLRLADERTLLTAAALITATSITIAALTANAWAMTAAIILTGLALGPVFPLAIGRASHHGDPARTTARVSILGYTAYLAGPPLIGLCAQGIGLPAAFTLTAILAAAGILLTAAPPNSGPASGDPPAPRHPR